eukprot:TRINITY_DN64786_c0_g1_i1.p1 TRINITY_DN64786_c0_g1~~TRINITY_DN64786_c0_g1_i1.p1  ORF type:complete len:405 (+),score=52.37 TRINITY_DN64786_c0_g1_i1:56-1270(+)
MPRLWTVSWLQVVRYVFEKDRTGRASCRSCRRKITKGKLRVRVSLSMAGDYFMHARAGCMTSQALSWMRKRGASAKSIPAAVQDGSPTPAQLKEAKPVFSQADEAAKARAVARAIAAKRPAARAVKQDRTRELRIQKVNTQKKFFVGRKGIVSKWHSGGRHLTNHFVKITASSASFVTLQEYEKQVSNLYGEPIEKRSFLFNSIDLAEADWNKKRKPCRGPEGACTKCGTLEAGHKVHINHVDGSFGKWRKCKVTGDTFEYAYHFEGDFVDKALDGSIPNWTEACPAEGEALNVRTLSGKLLLSLSKSAASDLRVHEIADKIYARIGNASQLELVADGKVLLGYTRVERVLEHEGATELTAILKDTPTDTDEQGRRFPMLAGSRGPGILSIHQALDEHRDGFFD